MATVPQTGLIGSEEALRQGLAGSLDLLQEGSRGLDGLRAQAGLLGPEAQQAAFDNFIASPEQAFLREQGEQALLRNQAAIGGLGGGNVRRELTRFGTGVAAQDFNNQFNRGLSALSAAQAPASQAANFAFGTGQNLASGRTQAGRDIAQARANNASALSNLSAQQGAGLSDIVGQNASSVVSLLQGAGAGDAATRQQLATLLANIATGSGSQVAGLPSIPGIQQDPGLIDSIGGLGQAAQGAGTAMIAFSDVRLKTDIQLVGRTVSGINLYTWDWNEEGKYLAGDEPTFGVLAQEVIQRYPEAVTIDETGFYKVDYTRIH